MIPICDHFTAWSRSQSSKTSRGLFPPVSKVMFFKLPAAARMMARPVMVLPVNAILSTFGCSERREPASLPYPLTIFTTPGGKPASLISVARKRAPRGVCSAGLRTTVFPQASAGPSFHAAIYDSQHLISREGKKKLTITGKFHGIICPHTPNGSCFVYANLSLLVSIV
jgi:hypothetical protein